MGGYGYAGGMFAPSGLGFRSRDREDEVSRRLHGGKRLCSVHKVKG
jgi:hypothetical protein